MTDDRAEFTANRDAGLVKRHEQRLARAQQAGDSQRLTEVMEDMSGLSRKPHRTHGFDAGCPVCKGSVEEIASALVFGGVILADSDEVKALVETATRLGRELGRREAAEEIAHRCELDATYDTASRYHFAKIAREIATKEPKAEVCTCRTIALSGWDTVQMAVDPRCPLHAEEPK